MKTRSLSVVVALASLGACRTTANEREAFSETRSVSCEDFVAHARRQFDLGHRSLMCFEPESPTIDDEGLLFCGGRIRVPIYISERTPRRMIESRYRNAKLICVEPVLSVLSDGQWRASIAWIIDE